MKQYRKRFITMNLALVGAVLALVMTAVSVFQYRDYRRELELTMSQVLRPLDKEAMVKPDNGMPPDAPADGQGASESEGNNAPGEKAQAAPKGEEITEPDGEPKAAPNGEPFNAEEPFEKEEPFEEGALPTHTGLFQLKDVNRQITAVFYSQEQGISVISQETDLDEATIAEAVNAVVFAEEDFGKLADSGLYYYRTGTADNYKIALAESSYLTKPVAESAGISLLIFLAAMGLFFGISYKLSALAVKPLEQSVAMEKQFVADASHDLKTPLTVILADNSILKENADSTVAEQMQWIESSDTAAKHMLDLIHEMLTLSAVDAAATEVKTERVNLSSVLTKAVLQMESVAYDKGVTLVSDIPDNIFVTGNAEYLSRIGAGLTDNALKYEPIGGEISVTLQVKKKKAVLTVQNRSTAIDPADLPHIFERFYRGDKARGGEGGHGLGLAIIKRMAEVMGAVVEAESNSQIGTVFTVKMNLTE